MWSNLPFDLLANIFSYLPPPSLARAAAVCRHWHLSAASTTVDIRLHPPWFVAFPTRTNSRLCLVHDPSETTWHLLNLDCVVGPNRPVSAIRRHGLVLYKTSGGVPVRLFVCNPFTGQFSRLPPLQKPRSNPALGVVEAPSTGQYFKLYVAGGMSEAAPGGGVASYEPTLEMFDSRTNKWTVTGSMPVEFAVRLTVWTPSESVCSSGVLYWMTSARTYSIMGIEIGTNKWRELSVPMGNTLEFAALVPHNNKLRVVGGTQDGNVSIWELAEGHKWNLIEKMPTELCKRLNSSGTKCVGIEGGICLYKDIGSGMVVWRRREGDKDNNNNKDKDSWKWYWIKGCNRVENFAIKGLFLHPNLATSRFISS